MVVTEDLEQLLRQRGLPYVMILDNCYFREPASGVEGFGREIATAFFDLSRMVSQIPASPVPEPSPRITLFAADRGGFVQAQPHPTDDQEWIGPLARRLLLMLDAADGTDLSVQGFLGRMSDPAFDPPTVAGRVGRDLSTRDGTLFLAGKGPAAGISTETRTGTGR